MSFLVHYVSGALTSLQTTWGKEGVLPGASGSSLGNSSGFPNMGAGSPAALQSLFKESQEKEKLFLSLLGMCPGLLHVLACLRGGSNPSLSS